MNNRGRCATALSVVLLSVMPTIVHAQREEFCCSQTFQECLVENEETAWCLENSSNCALCSGVWMDPTTFDLQCIPRWQPCTTPIMDCCGIAQCIPREGWSQCDVQEEEEEEESAVHSTECCSYNQKDCHWYDDASVTEKTEHWCHESSNNCVDCYGHWIHESETRLCTSRWGYCNDDETQPCCGDTVCLDNTCERPFCCAVNSASSCMEDNEDNCNYSAALCGEQCGGQWLSRSSTVAPPAPTPTARATIAPGYSERIVIPNPDEPTFLVDDDESSCPHLQTTTTLIDWNDATVWSVPEVAGQNVTLPPNTNIVLRESIPIRLGVITIPASSSLIIGESIGGATTIALDVDGMQVEGALIVGSETCRLKTQVIITLHGSRPAVMKEAPPPAYKGISVTGQLHLHGQRYFRTWTRLSQSAEPGDTQLQLQHATNWETGQEIVLVTTAMKDSREWHQNEVFTLTDIVVVDGTTTTVRLDKPVEYHHAANEYYQAEVGLLSRSIVVQGSADDSEPTDKDPLDCVNKFDRFGDTSSPCPYTEITGFGGHVIIHEEGKGYIEGVEFLRMGMTNALGRYPVHFHLLGDSCSDCYVEASSFYRSFYRCVSIHGTHGMRVSENVAFDVTGYCYYLEDGVEERNTIDFNLASFIHTIGPDQPGGTAQTTDVYQQNDRLTLPADVTASGFYITNVHNNLIGNSASGGWSGFAFPNLPTALQGFRSRNFRPSSVTSLTIDGNTAHSTGWWWGHAGAFYFGGSLYYNDNDILEYNPGRSFDFEAHNRRPCNINACERSDCVYGCPRTEEASLHITNTKAFQVSGTGFNSWSGTLDLNGYEAHDVGLSLESLSPGFWLDDMLAVCRTGESLGLPSAASATSVEGNGFVWYDTGQEHIISRSTFRQCGYRSTQYQQYDSSPDRGCGDESAAGCSPNSSVFGFLAHSDEFTPEIMQGTSRISFDNCGRRFALYDFVKETEKETVSGRGQNWLDTDGSVSQLNERTFIVSGLASVAGWLEVDGDVVYEPQGPLRFIRAGSGPERGLGHFRISWDTSVNGSVGESVCGNGERLPCPTLGFVRHAGKLHSSSDGLPVTARGDVLGPVGGFGWILELNSGPPKTLRFEQVEVLPDTPMLLSIAYPPGTSFTLSANAAPWCLESGEYSCKETFHAVDSIDQVRLGPGNQYYVDGSGVLTFRIVQIPSDFVGRPEWFIPQKTDPNRQGLGTAVERFDRAGVYLPRLGFGSYFTLEADCPGPGSYCSDQPPRYDPDVCQTGYEQTAYDRCCTGDGQCHYANGSRELFGATPSEAKSDALANAVGMVVILGCVLYMV